MLSASGRGPKAAVLYARVSTDGQVRSGYSLPQQMEALRAHCTREGYEVLEEVLDLGQSGASLERPGMDRVRDLVAAGGVSVVLAQDRDRFAREPAHLLLLGREFAEHGTEFRALEDRGGDYPGDELAGGILDRLSGFERSRIAERSVRGKLQKAREGRVVGGHPVNYGFRMNATGDGYEVDGRRMPLVRRLIGMVAEGRALGAVARGLNAEGIPGPRGGRWNTKAVRAFVLDDVYRPHDHREIAALVSAGVSGRLDPERSHGVWWYNRERWRRIRVSVPDPSGAGRLYRWRVTSSPRPRSEWVAVPVPDAGIPREIVEAARRALAKNVACSPKGDRSWELSGRVLRCAECGGRMRSTATRRKGKAYFYYACAGCRDGRGAEPCTNARSLRAEAAEEAVWGLVSGVLGDPGWIRARLEAMLERERRAERGEPDEEAGFWAERIAECARMRAGYQELVAGGLMTPEELGARLVELEDARTTAEGELDVLRSRRARLRELKSDTETLMADLAGAAAGPGGPGPERRRRLYGMLRLKVAARSDGAIEVREILGAGVTLPPAMAPAMTPARTTGPAARADAGVKTADDREKLRT